MPIFLNDGNAPFGSQLVTISGTTYIAEEIDFEEKTTSIYRRNEINELSGGVYIKDLITGKMTLQLGSESTPIPEGQSLVSMTFRGAPKDFVMTDVTIPQKQNEFWKIKCTITEIINPTNVVIG
jgi:hypothetical protein